VDTALVSAARRVDAVYEFPFLAHATTAIEVRLVDGAGAPSGMGEPGVPPRPASVCASCPSTRALP